MIDAHKNPKHIYVLMGIAIAFMFTIGAFFEEGVAFFDPIYTTIMSELEYYLSLIAVLLSVGIFLFLVHRYYTIKINWIFLSIAMMLVICNAIAVLAFPSIYETVGMDAKTGDTFPAVYFVTNSERLRFIITFAVTCLYLYLIFAVVPKVLRNSKQLTIYFYGGVVVVFVSIIWSFIFENSIYRAYFDPSMTPTLSTVVESFYNNRNSFGTMIVIGICACGYLQCQSHHWWNYLIMAFFSLELFFVLSKTSMLLVSIFWVAFLIYRYVLTIKAHPIRNNIILGIVLAIAGFWTWFVASSNIQQAPTLNKIFTNFVDAITDTSEDTMSSRANIWKLCIQELNNPFRVIFGMKPYESWDKDSFLDERGFSNLPSCPLFNQPVFKAFGLKENDKFQTINGISFYPSAFFSPMNTKTREISVSSLTRSIHHYTWGGQPEIDQWINLYRARLALKNGGRDLSYSQFRFHLFLCHPFKALEYHSYHRKKRSR